jgi:hypothetical protein
MPTLQDLSAELMGEIPGLSYLFAMKYVNRGISDIRKDYLWSWNIGEGVLICPSLVSTGTVTTTQFSASVVFDPTADAVLQTLVLANPPLIKRQFRVSGGPVYNILAYDSPSRTMTLDRIYTETSVSGSTYQIYRCYYDPPSQDGTIANTDFLRYLTILNPAQGYTLTGRRLYMPREELNRRDPLRSAQGSPYFAVSYRPTPNDPTLAGTVNQGQMQYELWPHPTFAVTLLAQYEKNHVDLAPGDYIPNQLDPSLVKLSAYKYAYRWAASNMGRIPELRGVDWRFLLADALKAYAIQLTESKRVDKEVMLNILRPGSGGGDFMGPIDSNFAQSHDSPWASLY